jgi:hypothetical protein
MPPQTTPPRIQNVGLRRVVVGILTAVALAACGSTAKHDPPSEKAQIAHAVAGVHEEGSKIEACEGLRTAGLTWAKALEAVVSNYGEPQGDRALTQADEASYKIEEASKKAATLVPSTAEAVQRFAGAIGRIRHATGEGEQALTAAIAEGTAAWKVVFMACDVAMTPGGASTSTSEGAGSYPQAIQTNFLHACAAFGAGTASCECALKEVEATIPTGQFVEDEEKLAEGDPTTRLASPLGRIIGHCAAKQ